MKRLLISTAIVGLAALPSFAVAQSDQGDDTTTQGQIETDSQVEAETSTDMEADGAVGNDSDTEDGAQSETDSDMTDDGSMGGSDASGSSDMESDSSTSGSAGTDGSGSSDMENDSSMEGASETDSETTSDMGSGSDGMSRGDKPDVVEGYSEADASTVEADAVLGAEVMSREGDDIADVSEVLLTEDGSIDSIIVNVGGVLGIGSKPVEIPFEEVTLQTSDSTGRMSIVIPMSQQELENMPEYEEG